MDTMIRASFAGAFISVLFAASSLYASWKNEKTPLDLPRAPGFAVVELFTSEGCSSCPPADKLLAELDARARAEHLNVYLLSFHVDYWNRLGWSDPYSDAAFSARQSAYAAKFGRDGVYTPQMIVNGSTEFVGHDRAAAVREIGAAIKSTAASTIRVAVFDTAATSVRIQYDLSGVAPGSLLHFALVDPEHVTEVRGGENGGRTLRHVNVVRALRTIAADRAGSGAVLLERSGTAKGARVVAWVQDPSTYRIEAAAAANL